MLLFNLNGRVQSPKAAGKTIPWSFAWAFLIPLGLWVLIHHFQSRYYPSEGFLVRRGAEYLIVWGDPLLGLSTRSASTLDEALRLAANDLKLVPRQGLNEKFSLEWSRQEQRGTSYVLFWKVQGQFPLNQISFPSQLEASFFESAFRIGAYTPSPFGHAVYLSHRD